MCLKMQESWLKVGHDARVLVRVLSVIFFTNISLSNGQNAPQRKGPQHIPGKRVSLFLALEKKLRIEMNLRRRLLVQQ